MARRLVATTEANTAQVRADEARALADKAIESGLVTRETAQLALANAEQAQSAAETAISRADEAEQVAVAAQTNANLAALLQRVRKSMPRLHKPVQTGLWRAPSTLRSTAVGNVQLLPV